MSRYPTPGETPPMRGTYDQSLLAYAPQINRADRQQGYDIDILERQPVAQPSYNGGRTRINLDGGDFYYNTGVNNLNGATLGVPPALPTLEKSPSYNNSSVPPPLHQSYDAYGKRMPWWRTKKGMVTIAVAVIVLMGLITGIIAGVVSAQNKSSTSNGAAPSTPLDGAQESSLATESSLPASSSTRSGRATATPTLSQVIPATETADLGAVPITALPVATQVIGGGNDEVVVDPIAVNTKPAICASFPNIPACRT